MSWKEHTLCSLIDTGLSVVSTTDLVTLSSSLEHLSLSFLVCRMHLSPGLVLKKL